MIDKKYIDGDLYKKLRAEAKAFLVLMSTRNHVPIDADEVAVVIAGIESGDSIQVRRGLINPSFYTGIVEDTKRIEDYCENLRVIYKNNQQIDEYHYDNIKPTELPRFQKLEDIFKDVPMQLPAKKQGEFPEIGKRSG